MSNLIKRILLAVVAIPLLLTIVLWLPQFSHLLLNIVIVVLSIIGGLETRNLFSKRKTVLNPFKSAVTAGLIPISTTLAIMGIIPETLITPIILVFLSIVFLIEALRRNQTLIKSAITRLPAYCFLLVFPGFFMSYMIKLNIFSESSILIIIFLTFVFANDTFAYFSGMLFGKTNRGIFAVSPKKSAAGLIGGLAAAGLSGYIYFLIFPHLFRDNPVFAVLAGAGIGLTSVIGDLLESALKRSADEKDSGTLMGGRGGVLDSIDSILFSAPLYYYIMVMLQLS